MTKGIDVPGRDVYVIANEKEMEVAREFCKRFLKYSPTFSEPATKYDLLDYCFAVRTDDSQVPIELFDIPQEVT